MTKQKFDYITFFYKVFIIFLLIAQGYSLLFLTVNFFTLAVNFIVMCYLVFRFYLLVNLSKKATRLYMTLPEFLAERKIKCCETCELCEICRMKKGC